MKVIRLYAVFPLVFLFSCCAVAARQEMDQVQQHFQGAQEVGELFEIPQDFEELDMDIKMVRAKKMKISIKDVPFYTKVFCSYVYEEKIKKWCQILLGYLSVSKVKVKKEIVDDKKYFI